MNIAIMANGFPPELTSARLNYEMARELTGRGHRVHIVTIPPRTRYSLMPTVSPGRVFRRQLINERLSVLRVGFQINLSEGQASRAVQYLLIPLALTLGMLVSPRPDVILCESPPLLSGVAAHIVSKIKRTPFVIRIQDIHPDVLQETGLVRNGLLIALMKMIEQFVYAKASLVTTISPSYRARILSKRVPPKKVKYIPNWADDLSISIAPPGQIRRRFGLDDDFLVTYAGTMSWFQDLETVIEAAKIVENCPRIRFLFVGDGAIKGDLVKKAKALLLKNVTFLPFQPRDLYYAIIKSSDVCLVSLKKTVTSPEMPSKVHEIMMAGTPLLANVPEDSDISAVIRDANCGLVVEPENPQAFAKGILSLYENMPALGKLGLQGKRYALAKFSLANSVSQLEGELLRLTNLQEGTAAKAPNN